MEEVPDALGVAGVQHVVGLRPPAPGGVDAVPDVRVLGRGVCVGVDGDGRAGLDGRLHGVPIEVQPRGAGVDLQRGARLGGRGRQPLDIDVERLATAAAEATTALEVNASPARLDLDGYAVKAAIDAGATIAIDTDAHSPGSFTQITYGVHTARRGWAEAGDVLNTRSADALREFLDG